ncbi:unnamed protein product [Sphagnum jensenii]
MGGSPESQLDKIVVGDQPVATGYAPLQPLNLYRDLHLIKPHLQTNSSFNNLDTQALYQSDSRPRTARTNLVQGPENHPSEVAAKKTDAPAQYNAVEESPYKFKKGDTSESIARKKLGPNASDAEVKAYATAINDANNIDDPAKLKDGTPLTLPAQTADGSITYASPNDKTLKTVTHPDGTIDVTNTTTSATARRVPDKDDPKSYTDTHKGPNADDNYWEHFKNFPDGRVEETASNATSYTRVPDEKNPNAYIETHKGPTPSDNYTFTQHADGSSESIGADGTKYTRTPDAKDANGFVEVHKGPNPDDNYTKTQHGDGSFEVVASDGTSYKHVPDKDHPQNYTETHHGPKPDDNFETHTITNPDGSYEVQNKTEGTSLRHTPVQNDPEWSYVDEHNGPTPDDNYVQQVRTDGSYELAYTNGRNYTHTPDKDDPTKYTDVHRGPDSDDNYTVKGDNAGSWVKYDANGKQIGSYDKKTDANTDIESDGARVTTYNSDGHTVTTGTDGTKETKWKDGSFKEEHADGTSKEHKVDASGNYTETGKGPKPADNYTETYDIKSGTTIRTEAKGTPQERTTTRTPDGTKTVLAKDGNNYIREPDGSEHHWGKAKFDKPAYDYTSIDKSRKGLDDAVHNAHPPLPPEKQAKMEEDMAAFEKRAKDQHLPPEEVSKSYDQMTRVLTTPDKDAAMPAENREMLVQGFLHQSAYPDQTDQGNHQTCNVTSEAENGFGKNPSKLAEIAATTAVTGQWVAPDGKVIKIDPASLKPGGEESDYPPADGARSYTTQVLNVVMVNDITQRRNPPQFYRQENADGGFVGDTGERLYDANGNCIKEKVMDPNDPKKWIDQPINEPTVTEGELTQSGKRIMGRDYEIIAATQPDIGVQDVSSPEALQHLVKQKADQGKLPMTVSVDGNHPPFVDKDKQEQGYGPHVVTIDGYNPATGEVHISNQWGQKSDKWVKPDDLYKNSSGEFSKEDTGEPAKHPENRDMNRELAPNPQTQKADSQDHLHLRADQPVPQTELLQNVSNLAPFRGLELPQTWHRQDQSTLIGQATTFSDPDTQSLHIVSLQHTKPIDQSAFEAFSKLLESKANATNIEVNSPDVLSSIAPVLGRSLVGDNQLSDVAKPGTLRRDPAFNLEDAQLKTLNGRNVLEVTGWYTQKDDQGHPKVDQTGAIAKRYYDGIFGLDASRKGVVSELYVIADDTAAFQKGKADFKKVLGSIEWK